ncbi:MAG: helix-turn-helix domain-containing protein [Kurthia sp.]|nr:helix-turn-helix domain-containing protein [Candidatus Kurthia equi]
MGELGQVLKSIRLNRGYSQLLASHRIVSQGVYSKVEAGTRDLDAAAFFKIANRMNVTPDEIEFISNGYDYNEKQKILNQFFKLNYNNPDKLQDIKQQAMTYLKIEDDVELREVYLLCEALLIVSNKSDFEAARKVIEPISTRLKTYNEWYLYDIRLINMFLFMYPLDTTIAFSEKVLQRLKCYDKHEKVEQLKDIFNINLSLLYIKTNKANEALALIEERLKDRQHMSYTMLALSLSRRALCKKILKMPNYEEDQQVVKNILQAYEAHDLLERVEEEFEKYAV